MQTNVRISGILPSAAARRLGISLSRLRDYLNDGRLAYSWGPSGREIDPDSLERLAAERAERANRAR